MDLVITFELRIISSFATNSWQKTWDIRE